MRPYVSLTGAALRRNQFDTPWLKKFVLALGNVCRQRVHHYETCPLSHHLKNRADGCIVCEGTRIHYENAGRRTRA
jgi:hypothetical protein